MARPKEPVTSYTIDIELRHMLKAGKFKNVEFTWHNTRCQYELKITLNSGKVVTEFVWLLDSIMDVVRAVLHES